MIFINPWAYYQIHEPDKIPNLNPQDDEEAIGCIFGVCGFVIASAIFVLLMLFILNFRLNDIISTDVYFILILINCIIIYPILTIILMKLAFKIADKFISKKKNKGYENNKDMKTKVIPTKLKNVFNGKDEALSFDVDTPRFIKEVAENSGSTMYAACWNIFKGLLAKVAERATELNDPVLNTLMIRLNLYEIPDKERYKVIKQLKEMYDKSVK